MLEKIKYECRNCRWHVRVPEQWGDLKPAYCGNPKCEYSKAKAAKTKKSFRSDPDKLKIVKPKSRVNRTEDVNKAKKAKEKVSSEKRDSGRKKRTQKTS